jgi:hypothetical protein
MKVSRLLAPGTFLLMALMLCASGCVVRGGGAESYHEGYWDRDHNRWWHENAWHGCEVNDVHCR